MEAMTTEEALAYMKAEIARFGGSDAWFVWIPAPGSPLALDARREA